MKRKTRQIVSSILLKTANFFPKKEKGILSRLQRASRVYDRTIEPSAIPDEVGIKLTEIHLITTFQIENFKEIRDSIKNTFPMNRKIGEFLNGLENNEASLVGSGWTNVGMIKSEKDSFATLSTATLKLPDYVESVHVQYNRILPSVACLAFTFHVEDKCSEVLLEIQKDRQKVKVVLEKLWPPRRLGTSYSYDFFRAGNNNDIEQFLGEFKSNLETWLFRKVLKITSSSDVILSDFEGFEISGCSVELENDPKWYEQNETWLKDFGLSRRGGLIFSGSGILYLDRTTFIERSNSEKLITFHTDDHDERYFRRVRVSGFHIKCSLVSILDNIQHSLERSRLDGFTYLNKANKFSVVAANNAIKLNRVIMQLKRISHEISNEWPFYNMSDVYDLEAHTYDNRTVDYRTHIKNSLDFRLKNLLANGEIVESSLTEQLQARNTLAVFKLQSKMLLLSTVGSVVAIVTLLAQWESIIGTFNQLTSGIKNLF